ncbi:uncharacterized protein [Dysidea avara]|uniref:uncharacterized protein isoform X1 n=2 Tax=Dysidea avara TaxID=196820 RepID=UPI0033246C7A
MLITGLVAILLVSLCRVQAGTSDCGTDCTGENCTNNCQSPTDTTQCLFLPNITCVESGKVCEDIHQLSVPEDVECCSETLSCGASDVSNVDNAIMNLTHKWVAVNSTIVKLVIKWNQLADDHGAKLFIKTKDTSVYDRCHCLPPHTREYSVDVELSVGKILDVVVVGLPYHKNIRGQHIAEKTFTTLVPSDCWDENVTGRNIEMCGNRLPTSPQHIDTNVTRVDSSVAKLCVTWGQPVPDSNSVIIAYMITISHINTVYYVNAETLQYCTDVPTGCIYHIKVSATPGEVINANKIYCTTNCTNDSEICCWGPAISTEVSTPAVTSSSSQKPIVLVAVICSVGVIAALAVVMTVTLLCVHYRKTHTTVQYIPLVSRQVLIINSPQSDDDDLCLMRKLCHNLADHSIKPITYEYYITDRRKGPGHSGIYQWAEDNFLNSDMILFVCNKSLHDVWNSGDTEQSSFVSACKLLLQGYLSSSEDLSRFGIILLRESDACYIPSLYLRNFKTFTVFQNGGQCSVEDLVDCFPCTN